jgi:hypothetical protein
VSKSLVGVAPVYLTWEWGKLKDMVGAPHFPKRELLIFDHLFIVGLDHFLTSLPKHYRASLEWLIEKDIVKTFHQIEKSEPAYQFVRSALQELDMLYEDKPHKVRRKNMSDKETVVHYFSFHNNLARATAAALNDKSRMDAIALIPAWFFYEPFGDNDTSVQQSVRVVIHNLPFLDVDTPLEDILAFKNEENTTRKLSALRRWMKRTATSFEKPDDLQEEIEWLLEDYERYMKIQRMQYSLCTVEALFTVAAELVEDVVKFRLKKLVQKSFSIFRQPLRMLEEEMKAPGRELAFFIDADRRFPPAKGIDKRRPR